MRIVLGILAVTALCGGCNKPAPVVASAPSSEQVDNQKCAEYGFKRGTDGFAKCRLDLDRERKRDTDALSSAMLGSALQGSRPYMLPTR